MALFKPHIQVEVTVECMQWISKEIFFKICPIFAVVSCRKILRSSTTTKWGVVPSEPTPEMTSLKDPIVNVTLEVTTNGIKLTTEVHNTVRKSLQSNHTFVVTL